MVEKFDRENAKEFIYVGEMDELPCVIKNLAINNLNVYITLSTGKKLYALDYKNSSFAEIQSEIQLKRKIKALFGNNLSKDEPVEEQGKTNYEVLLTNKLLSDIYEQGELLIYEEKMPAWGKLIVESQQTNTLKNLVDALSVMRSLENGDMELAKTTLKHLASTEEKSIKIQKIVTLFSKFGPEFFEIVNNDTLSASDKIELDLLKNRNETFAKREQAQTNGWN